MIEQLPILQVTVPLIAAPLCVLLGNRKLTYVFALAVCWATFGISLALMSQVLQTGTDFVRTRKLAGSLWHRLRRRLPQLRL